MKFVDWTKIVRIASLYYYSLTTMDFKSRFAGKTAHMNKHGNIQDGS